MMNFQNIRNEFVMQCKEQELAMKEMERQAKLEEDLARQYRSHSVSSRYSNAFADLSLSGFESTKSANALP